MTCPRLFQLRLFSQSGATCPLLRHRPNPIARIRQEKKVGRYKIPCNSTPVHFHPALSIRPRKRCLSAAAMELLSRVHLRADDCFSPGITFGREQPVSKAPFVVEVERRGSRKQARKCKESCESVPGLSLCCKVLARRETKKGKQRKGEAT